MRTFKLSKRQNDWTTIGAWKCRYEDVRFCACCQPKHVVGPGVLKAPKDVRDYFRQLDSTGKSKTPRGSKHPDRHWEPRKN